MGTRKSLPSLKAGILIFLPLSFFFTFLVVCFAYSFQVQKKIRIYFFIICEDFSDIYLCNMISISCLSLYLFTSLSADIVKYFPVKSYPF